MVQDVHKRVQFYGKVAEGGNDSRVSVAHHASLNFSDAFSVCARVYLDPSMPGANKGIVTKCDMLSTGGGFWFEYDNIAAPYARCFAFVVVSGGVLKICNTTSTVPPEAGWYHVVATFDRTLGAANQKVFQNAVQMASLNNNVAMDTNLLNVLVGAEKINDGMFKGYISEVQIYNRALTESEINYNYLHPNNPKRRGLVMSLVQTSIDKPAAGTWKDVSPQTGNNGTITNATTSKYPAISAGRNDIAFDGVDDNVNFGDITDFGATDFTISCWIKAPFFGDTWNGLLTKGYSTGAPAHTWGIIKGANNYGIYYQDTTNGGGAWNANMGVIITDGWHHVVVRRVGTVYTILIDGVLKATQNVAAVDLTNASSFTVAAWSGPQNFVRCNVNEIALYSRGLSDTEIKYNFSHPNNPVRRGQIFRASMESLYGTRWYDISGGGWNGTILGSPRIRNLADSLTGD